MNNYSELSRIPAYVRSGVEIIEEGLKITIRSKPKKQHVIYAVNDSFTMTENEAFLFFDREEAVKFSNETFAYVKKVNGAVSMFEKKINANRSFNLFSEFTANFNSKEWAKL